MRTDNLRPLAVELARMTGYSFDDGDWIAIEHGIGGTDAEDGRWFGYPLGRVTIRAALEPGADEMVAGAADLVVGPPLALGAARSAPDATPPHSRSPLVPLRPR